MDKFKVRVDRRLETDKEAYDADFDLAAAIAAEWTDDPGEGKAILLPDGREVLNPIPHDPPIGYKPQDSMMVAMERMVAQHLSRLEGDMTIDDSIQEALDFDINDGYDPPSPYDVEMMEDFPQMPSKGEEEAREEEGENPPPPPDPKKKEPKKAPKVEKPKLDEEGA